MRNNDALYMKIYNYLRQNIENNYYAGGKRLPTEMELAKEFYVSRITSKKALNALAEEGLIIRIPGRGSYVNDNNIKLLPEQPNYRPGKLIALVMGGYSSFFGLDTLTGVQEAAQASGLNLVVKITHNNLEEECKIITSLISSGVSGIIVQPCHGELYNPVILKAVLDGYPIVMIDRKMQGINAPFVGVDNSKLSEIAVRKLIESNHRHISLLSVADEKSSTINERMNGFVQAFINSIMAVDKSLWLTNIISVKDKIQSPNLHNELYQKCVEKIAAHLKANPQISAVFGTEYYVSKAAFDAVVSLGKRVPEDISIASFDIDSNYNWPHYFSHVKQPEYEMGYKACEVLENVINKVKLADNNFILDGKWIDGNTIRDVGKD